MDKQTLSIVFSVLIGIFLINAQMLKKTFREKKYSRLLNHIIVSLIVLLTFLVCMIRFW
jgi:hypothetical protein